LAAGFFATTFFAAGFLAAAFFAGAFFFAAVFFAVAITFLLDQVEIIGLKTLHTLQACEAIHGAGSGCNAMNTVCLPAHL